MSILPWALNERPREKLLRKGVVSLSDVELLAMIFQTGVSGKHVLELAKDVLKETEGLPGLFDCSLSTFSDIKGLGVAKYAVLQAALELTRRYLFEELQEKVVLDNAAETKKYFIARLGHLKQEKFSALFLNGQHQVLKFVELFQGSVAHTSVYPGEIARKGLELSARSVIVAHNHPSGSLTPSTADLQLTKVLKKALALVDLHLIDHVIVAGNQTVSLAERGYL